MSEQEHGWAVAGAPARRNGASGRGWRVLGILAVLTAVEFIVAIALDANVPVLAVIAVVKAALIVHYFMHISRVWRGAEEEA